MAAIVEDLLRAFPALGGRPPGWAWPVPPAIPLVGAEFESGAGLMILASAENLSWMNLYPLPHYFTTEVAWNRYRAQYEETGRHSAAFFPNVGIQPITDGGLFCAGLFAAQRLGLPTRTAPRQFLETIAVSNWCKFSIRAAKNDDYVSDLAKLEFSLPYVLAELALLAPAVVILPQSIWCHPSVASAMRQSTPHTRFLPTKQFNAQVVNCHLSRYDQTGHRLREEMRGTVLAEWMAHLRGISLSHAWRYIAWLAENGV